MKRLLLMITAVLLTACGGDPYRNLYDGINSSNEARRSPTQRAASPAPGYAAYKKERDAPQQQ